jgi:hypothetical protein
MSKKDTQGAQAVYQVLRDTNTVLESDSPPADARGNGITIPVISSFSDEFNGTTWDRVRHSFFQNTTGIVAAAAGAAVDMSTTPMSKFAIQVVRTAGAAAFVVDLEGGLIDGNYFRIVAHSAVDGDITWQVDRPVRFMRYNVTTIGAANTLTVRILASGR